MFMDGKNNLISYIPLLGKSKFFMQYALNHYHTLDIVLLHSQTTPKARILIMALLIILSRIILCPILIQARLRCYAFCDGQLKTLDIPIKTQT